MLSQFADEDYAYELLKDGAAGLGYLLKERVANVEEVVRALEEVSRGGSVLDPKVVEALVAAKDRMAHSPLGLLTDREREVLSLMAQGMNNAAIAKTLFLTERAVEKHINSMFHKLGSHGGTRCPPPGDGGPRVPPRDRPGLSRPLPHWARLVSTMNTLHGECRRTRFGTLSFTLPPRTVHAAVAQDDRLGLELGRRPPRSGRPRRPTPSARSSPRREPLLHPRQVAARDRRPSPESTTARSSPSFSTYSTTSSAPRSRASRAASSTARSAEAEVSVPTRIVVMSSASFIGSTVGLPRRRGDGAGTTVPRGCHHPRTVTPSPLVRGARPREDRRMDRRRGTVAGARGCRERTLRGWHGRSAA